jgi:glycosyltransferase involved in cell wall biosynthesis
MRLGVVWQPAPGAAYRAIEPMKAMVRRGHEVTWPSDRDGEPDLSRLAGCDVVHVYRRGQDGVRQVLQALIQRGTTITYDNDDNLAEVPKQSPTYKKLGGFTGQRVFAETVKAARLAHTCTTTNKLLAETYRRAGVERVEVIENFLAPDVPRPRSGHDGVVVGWIAGGEHRADSDRIKVADALERLLAEHENLRVECIGVNLGLTERYRHDPYVPFEELPGRIGGFDIGIAPLADIPWNWTRSDIKLKEYAASGVPWLASPVGPYQALGEEQGGRLVADDGWFEALERLVTHGRERRRLARKAQRWARRQTIDAAADRWEHVFAAAAGGA